MIPWRARRILRRVPQHDEDELDYVPKRDRSLVVRFVLLLLLMLGLVVVGFDFIAGLRIGRFIAAGFETVTDPGAADGGTPRDGEVPSPRPVE